MGTRFRSCSPALRTTGTDRSADALALTARAPIFVTAEVLASNGLTRADLEKLQRSEADTADGARDVEM